MNLVIIYLFIPITSLDDELIKNNWCSWEKKNRPFHWYGGHIELIRFKEYYGMPRGALAQYLRALSDASISDRTNAPWASHNTP